MNEYTYYLCNCGEEFCNSSRCPSCEAQSKESMRIEFYCCEFMKQQLQFNCKQHLEQRCPQQVIKKTSSNCLMILDNYENAMTGYIVNFCPSCGSERTVRLLKYQND